MGRQTGADRVISYLISCCQLLLGLLLYFGDKREAAIVCLLLAIYYRLDASMDIKS